MSHVSQQGFNNIHDESASGLTSGREHLSMLAEALSLCYTPHPLSYAKYPSAFCMGTGRCPIAFELSSNFRLSAP
eukprot:jgi/Botrbrau1/6291/Bobra.0339s0002.1